MRLFTECEPAFLDNYDEIAEKVLMCGLKMHECDRECQISLFIVGDEVIKATNAETRGIDRVTDVLSFPNVEFGVAGDFSTIQGDMADYTDPATGEMILGEIMISAAKAKSQAEEYGHSLIREYAFLVAHSLLHLLGYDHVYDAERELMEKKQEEILTSLGIVRERENGEETQ